MAKKVTWSRRQFLSATAMAVGAGLAPLGNGASRVQAAEQPAPGTTDRPTPRADRPTSATVLLRSSWQTVNIGDIAHTPGVLALLEKHWPEAEVILWAGKLDRGVEPLLRARFPKLRLIRERALAPTAADLSLADAFRAADVLLHGSGPSLVAAADVQTFVEKTGKPWGPLGITVTALDDRSRALFARAAFVYTRETRSLQLLRDEGISAPQMAFAPDGTIALDLADEPAAVALLKQYDLESGKFLCVVPRLRYTPYWKIHPDSKRWTPELIAERQAVNDATTAGDHEKLRTAIIRWVRETRLPVLACPEMTYQVELLRPLLVEPLPADVQPFVRALDRYWLTAEAASTYRHAAAVLSMECHSPLIAYANGTPAIHVAQPTDTWKSQMYPDLGLGEWKFAVDDATGDALADRLLGLHADPAAAKELLAKARTLAADRHAAAFATARAAIRG